MNTLTRGLTLWLAALLWSVVSHATTMPTAPVHPQPVQSKPAGPAPPMSGPQIIQLLDRTIDWYRSLGIQQQAANEPSDLLILYDNRQTANRVVALAFEIARANADLLAQQPVPLSGGDAAAVGASSQTLTQLQAKFAAKAIEVQTELEGDRRALEKAAPKEAPVLKAKIAELQGELDLSNARKTLLGTMASFATESRGNSSPDALKTQIDAMAIVMPASINTATTQAPATTPTTPAPAASSNPLLPTTGASVNVATRFGIWDLVSNVFRLSEKLSTINSLGRRTAALQDQFAALRAPIVESLKGMSAAGDALAGEADNADMQTLDTVRGQLNALAAQFKEASASLLPLSREGVLLNQYHRNLDNWHNLIEGQYHDALLTLGIRLLVLLGVLLLIIAAAELWRRMVVRYVHDARRVYQLLLLRRIAMWSLIVIIVGLAFASELTSVVTFAGLITAGLAVAMQSVLVSIVGYFFLIGKYGIRVGDRVQIGDVAGEVIELGLVRLHLAELGGKGQLGPTGRVVAFANSVVFQVSTGLFKQIPGVNFAWHEITVKLPPNLDYAATKEKLTAVANEALQDSHEELTRQTRELARTTSTDLAEEATARVQLNFSAAGVEAKIRYPVHSRSAAEIDERVSRELSSVVAALSRSAAS